MKREKGVRHHWEITLGTETFQENTNVEFYGT